MDLNKGKRARGSNFTKEEELLLVRSACISWGNYTSKKLKRAMSKRLRRILLANIYFMKKKLCSQKKKLKEAD
ncbi:unnamed protein product [Acanthoscelides obtectus]|uniref:Uncharacterized protein n=1 Tax=Acanthoscelides obtectus TaxID=200917 RepID=A0A9P0KRS4_ACAOB|nr:unnamed protein product [Acanthoscelides obtectus]CAK1670213.1 hypothetical protein AOBTE_LOCUS27480 [Acanthoscelides obtectus]